MKDLGTIKQKQVSQDLTDKVKMFEDFVNKQRGFLSNLQDQIDQKRQVFEVMEKEIIEGERRKEGEIIFEAQKDKERLKDLEIKLKNFEQELKDKSVILTTSSEQLNQREKMLIEKEKENQEQQEKLTLQYQDKIAQLLKQFSSKVEQPENLLTDLVGLVSVVIEKTQYLSKIENDVVVEVVGIFEEAQKLFAKTTLMSQMFELEKENLKNRAKELREKEIWLKDQQQTLERSVKEYGYK